jgi:hypothetical protein
MVHRQYLELALIQYAGTETRASQELLFQFCHPV